MQRPGGGRPFPGVVPAGDIVRMPVLKVKSPKKALLLSMKKSNGKGPGIMPRKGGYTNE
jgi:hypothetical protein